jgi:hypothetical protein
VSDVKSRECLITQRLKEVSCAISTQEAASNVAVGIRKKCSYVSNCASALLTSSIQKYQKNASALLMVSLYSRVPFSRLFSHRTRTAIGDCYRSKEPVRVFSISVSPFFPRWSFFFGNGAHPFFDVFAMRFSCLFIQLFGHWYLALVASKGHQQAP